MPDPHTVTVEIDGRTLKLTNLDKVLYPGSNTTKAEVAQYYAAIAPVLLPQLQNRPLTRLRFPHGTAGESFFEKNTPKGAPGWLRRVTLVSPHSRRADELVTYPLVDDVAALTWLANLAALELHVPQWRVTGDDESGGGSPQAPDRLVVDLDPGAPAGLGECAQVALLVREALLREGISRIVPVTSGSKGLQLYGALDGSRTSAEVRELAKTIAGELSTQRPELVLATMTRARRTGKVLFDWSQNTHAKTTICPYSLRGKRNEPFVAAPRSWEEIEAGAVGAEPLTQLAPFEVLDRVESDGDLMTALLD
ncbi:non-homologous end-joining DNA ligase [Gephyromycinifex aptenodytis]|uniref:non-homologous end-joining DNA ligase n=1 Tax=Gephyromycinifex aptenodytis TaxID=2716227 RepID=UPI001445A0AF|nr:non-homologous end-joining DNA ligase [Gephyromycinifex aptenodytis]